MKRSKTEKKVNRRLNKRASKAKKITYRTLLVLLVIFAVGITGAIGGGVYLIHRESENASQIKLNLASEPITQNLKITDVNGEVLASSNNKQYYTPAVINSKEQNVPDVYLKTLVAIEDNTFYTRKTKGYDIKGIVNAGLSYVKAKLGNGVVRGGSSIDQQLVKNLVLGGSNAEESFQRKIVEVIDSHEMAKNYSRDEILTAYIDSIRLTSNTIGVSAAWADLFDDDFKQDSESGLYLSQIAFMAGLGQNPSIYTQQFEKYGKQRTLTVLGVMKSKGIITSKQYDEAIKATKEKLKLKTQSTMSVPKNYQPYIAQVNKELYNMNLPTYANLTIKTWAKKADLDNLAKIANFTQPSTTVGPRQTLPDGTIDAISVVDTKTGHILGLATNSNNPLTPITSGRSSGSTIKPLLDYAPALEYGKINANSTLNGNTSAYSDGTPLYNYGSYNFGGVNATYALGNSLNTAAFQVFSMTTTTQKNSIMRPMGIASTSYKDSDSIGYDLSTLQEASAYQAIGNDGVHIEATAIATIEIDNKNIEIDQPVVQRAMSSSTSATLIQMMQGVTAANGSEPLAAQPQWAGAFAAKSGLVGFDAATTNKINAKAGLSVMPSSDAWMAATTSGVTVSAWLGTENFSGDSYIVGGGTLGENNGRVYLLNNTLKLMNPETLPVFTHSGKKLNSTLSSETDIPTVKEGVNSSSLKDASQFSLQLPTVTTDLQTFYDQNKDKDLIDSNKVFKNLN